MSRDATLASYSYRVTLFNELFSEELADSVLGDLNNVQPSIQRCTQKDFLGVKLPNEHKELLKSNQIKAYCQSAVIYK